MKNTKDLHYQNATELVAQLANKKISATELLEETIARIEALDKKINALPVRDFERARAAAKLADTAIAKGEHKSLLGLPMSVKETFNVAGLPTTWGNPQFKNWHPDEDALSVTRLKTAGAVIIGKTNVPFMLADWQSYNDIYGTTNNPWDLKLTPGGSSGGSAAALAAGFVALELGSDLAGSLRVPAHYCGIYAHKPTQDLIPLRGSSPPKTPALPRKVDLAVAGPMARTAIDLKLGLDILAGPDELTDGKGYKLVLPFSRHNKLQDFRVLVLDNHPLYPTANNITKSIDDLAIRLNKLGAKVTYNKNDLIPLLTNITQNYIFFLGAFLVSRMPMEEYNKMQLARKNLSENDDSIHAHFLRGATATYREWILAGDMRDKFRQQWKILTKEFDGVLTPVMPTCALPHDHSKQDNRQIEIDGKLFPYDDQFIWVCIANLFGLPATVAPIGLSENNLPIGIQIISDYLEDNTTIKFAELLEREFGGFIKPNNI